MNASTSFEPGRHLTKISGADYLEVKWRLVWLRDAHPDARIETELVSHDDAFALFRAKVSVPDGGSATGWGSEGIGDFRDYIEKAETKAIGRALAALGFGTQFCPDFDFGAAAGRIVDAPIDFASSRGRLLAVAGSSDASRPPANGDHPATERQIAYIRGIAAASGLDEEALQAEAESLTGSRLEAFNRRHASALIERLKVLRTRTELAS